MGEPGCGVFRLTSTRISENRPILNAGTDLYENGHSGTDCSEVCRNKRFLTAA